MVCYDLNIVFTAEAQRAQRVIIFHLPASQRQMKRKTISLRSLRLCGEKCFILEKKA